jgi:hypothetical protein
MQEREFMPDDTQLADQWHHATMQSFDAWSVSRGSAALRVAIVDTPSRWTTRTSPPTPCRVGA